MKVIDYKLLKESLISHLEVEVVKHLGEGWQPHGCIREYGGYLVQPMAKYESRRDVIKSEREAYAS